MFGFMLTFVFYPCRQMPNKGALAPIKQATNQTYTFSRFKLSYGLVIHVFDRRWPYAVCNSFYVCIQTFAIHHLITQNTHTHTRICSQISTRSPTKPYYWFSELERFLQLQSVNRFVNYFSNGNYQDSILCRSIYRMIYLQIKTMNYD